MLVRHLVWTGERPPREDLIRNALEAEGFEVYTWRDPCDRAYAPHQHDIDESLWILAGAIDVAVGDEVFHLHAGDRLHLPSETVRSARVGPSGARYLIGRRFDPN